MNINKGQGKTSILLFFLKSSLKIFDSGKKQKVSDIAPVSPTKSCFQSVEVF
jgi:hypothetical protein